MNNALKMAEIPLGMPADEVLKRWKQPLRVKRLGLDKDLCGWMSGIQGKVYEWEYPWGVLTFKRRRADVEGHGPHCYRVVGKKANGV